MLSPPLALYVHLPWCVRKCPYCDFNSHTAGDNAPRARYIAALLVDLENEIERAQGRSIVSVFLGGGTPSLFPPADIARLMDGIRQRFELSSDVEITMEANPGTVECGDPAGYRDAGINRLSIGAQSFDAAMLQTLGRIHSVDDIARAVKDAQRAGFDNINIDIMYGLPGQDIDGALNDLRAAANQGGAASDSSVRGTIRLYVARYLHVEAHLIYENPYAANQALFELRESRRMRSGELHYFDHPVFGALVRVTPYQPPGGEFLQDQSAPAPADEAQPPSNNEQTPPAPSG